MAGGRLLLSVASAAALLWTFILYAPLSSPSTPQDADRRALRHAQATLNNQKAYIAMLIAANETTARRLAASEARAEQMAKRLEALSTASTLRAAESDAQVEQLRRKLDLAPQGSAEKHADALLDDGRNFLLATRAEPATTRPLHLQRQLRTLLGMARLLNRTLVLPAAWCDCRDTSQLTDCSNGPVHPLFDCPVREPLGTGNAKGVLPQLRPPRVMLAKLPDSLRCSHVRLTLPLGLDSEQLSHALRHYASTRLLEVDAPHETYCGPSTRASEAERAAEAALDEFVSAAFDGGGGSAQRALPTCSHSLKEEEVSQYYDMGKCEEHEVRVNLPAEIRSLPAGTDLMVTFATGSVATMAANWVAALRRAGVESGVLIGALDEPMMNACAARALPCVRVDGGAVSSALSARTTENVRADPKLYPKMSVLKVGFYRELLRLSFNVWACDADAVFMSDPRPLMRSEPWLSADVAVATDCIDLPGDAARPLLHCDFNTGLVYLRASEAVLDFTMQWREKVANAKEARIRDQAAFNMITKAAPGLRQYKTADGKPLPRIYTAGSAEGRPLRLGVLPLAQFLNGHTFFVQHAHLLPNAATPVSVHMTYQFAEGTSFAYGKRQRLRESGLWFVDPPEYYTGRYVTVAAAGANVQPVTRLSTSVDSREAVALHLREHAHALAVVRALLGIGKALGREVILPRLLCYCDYMWKEMRACRVGGAESMRLPFDCPMDHVLNTPSFFENGLGVPVKEPNFLNSSRLPANVSANVARVRLPAGVHDDEGVRAALAHAAHAAVIEVDDVANRFCGFRDSAQHAHFVAETDKMLEYKRVPFCTVEGSENAPLYSRCCEPWHPGDKFFPCIQGFDGPAPLPACAAAS